MKKSIVMLSALVSVCAFAAEPNLLLNAKATASSQQDKNYPASKAVDGNISTRWSSKFTDKENLTLDMGAVKTISRVVIRWETAAGKEYKLQLSKDNKTWGDAAVVKNGMPQELKTLTFKPQQARYVRIAGTKRATGFGYSIWEISAFAK